MTNVTDIRRKFDFHENTFGTKNKNYEEQYLKDNKGKVRHYLWFSFSILSLSFVLVATNFVERCQQNFVFTSFSFKLTCVLFFSYLLVSMLCYSKVTSKYKSIIYFHLWKNHMYLCILDLSLAIGSIFTFTYSVYPAYQGACIAFTCLFALLLVSLNCMLLYD